MKQDDVPEILQIIPAPAWLVIGYKQTDGTTMYMPVTCLALVKQGGMTRVTGIDITGGGQDLTELPDEIDNFAGFFERSPDLHGLKS